VAAVVAAVHSSNRGRQIAPTIYRFSTSTDEKAVQGL
jgi:hypothetical protein